MDENINKSVETQEVAEPETEALESAEEQEVAEPADSEEVTHEEKVEQPSGRTEQDAAFAEMRRAKEELERNNQLLMEAMGLYFDGDTAEELYINANAYAEQREPDDYREEYEQNKEFESLQSENATLKEELNRVKAERMMREDLTEIQAIDPEIGSLDELGEDFIKLRLDGNLTAKQAYYASKAIQLNEKVLAPSPIGKIESTSAERDYFTEEEIDSYSVEDMVKDPELYAKIQRSLARLNKKH